MAALRGVVEGLGHTEVATYIQSGNVVFTSEDTDTGALERAIGEQLRVRPRVVVLTCTELTRPAATEGRDGPQLGDRAEAARHVRRLTWTERGTADPAAACRGVRCRAGQEDRVAFTVMSRLPRMALEIGQPFSASSAACWKPSWS
jgi:hypothetical protein